MRFRVECALKRKSKLETKTKHANLVQSVKAVVWGGPDITKILIPVSHASLCQMRRGKASKELSTGGRKP